MEISSSMVKFPSTTPLGKTEGFLATPKPFGKYPGIIIAHEIWGLVDHIKDVCMRLAREGYVALGVDLRLHPLGFGNGRAAPLVEFPETLEIGRIGARSEALGHAFEVVPEIGEVEHSPPC